MKKYASILTAALLFVSAQSWSGNTTLDKEQTFLNGPKKKKPATATKQSSTKDLAAANVNSVSLEELGSLLKEIDANEDLNEANYLTEQLLNVAEDYKGVRYRFGGMSRDGMDCSGFVKTAFDEFNISLPRSSRDMASMGKKINRSEAQKGDLIFFKTGKSSRISHVGIVTEVSGDEIKFIHSSTSQGVIISSTNEAYYQRTFAQVNRVYSSSMF